MRIEGRPSGRRRWWRVWLTARVRLVMLLLGLAVLLSLEATAVPTQRGVLAVQAAMVVCLLALAVGVHRRRVQVAVAGPAAFAATSVAVLAGIGARTVGAGDVGALVQTLMTLDLWSLAVALPVAFLVLDVRRAFAAALALLGAATALVTARLLGEAAAGRPVGEAAALGRVAVALAVLVGLVATLAHVRVQLVASEARSRLLADEARTDALTGLGNRRRLEEVLAERRVEAQRYGRPLSVLVGDIDRFKAVNDSYGHAAGDEVLSLVSRILGATVRDADVLGRWGGEEFLIVAPHTTGADAVTLGERCRSAVADATVPGVGLVTISLGAAQWRQGESTHELLLRADQALYAAKRRGRNLVVLEADSQLPALEASGG